MIKLTLVPAPPETGCDKCPWPGACHMARHRFVEKSATGEVGTNLCDRCLEEESGSWDQRGGFAPEFVVRPPEPARPPATTLMGYHQWALGYAGGERWTGTSSESTSDVSHLMD